MDSHIITSVFPHTPTKEQFELFCCLDTFLKSPAERSAFILKGYAGTGKTTVLGAVIKILGNYKLKSVLLAPTGRAAKVLSAYSGKPAQTIHKRIYWKRGNYTAAKYELATNMHTQTLFIIDEASMIPGVNKDQAGMSSSLLDDLISYVYNKKGCRVLFLGDTAQLPPVGLTDSPALVAGYLEDNYNLDVSEFELTEVVRQDALSGILENSTQLRNLLLQDNFMTPQIQTNGFDDIFRIAGDRLEDELNDAYQQIGIEDTLVICRSNKSVNLFNQHIRSRILGFEEEINANDYIMVVRNNYFWLPAESELGFLANGDVARITRIKNIHDQYGFRFADADLEFRDYVSKPVISCRIMLDTLTLESPSLGSVASKQLYERIIDDYAGVKSKKERLDKVKESPYYQALQIKFAYAVTCHKAQGGQWEAVFIDQGYINAEMLNNEFNRWLYTACTRAVKKLYLLNFNKKFFSDQEE